jgi:hypothetical protein
MFLTSSCQDRKHRFCKGRTVGSITTKCIVTISLVRGKLCHCKPKFSHTQFKCHGITHAPIESYFKIIIRLFLYYGWNQRICDEGGNQSETSTVSISRPKQKLIRITTQNDIKYNSLLCELCSPLF